MLLFYDLFCVSTCILAYLFFFFQAEDGIRDLTVTGVQTCALPISRQGQRARLTFSGTAGQRLNLGFPGASIYDSLTVWKPDGTLFASSPGTTDLSMVMPPLPTTGTYGILIDPTNVESRSMTLTLSEEISGAIVIDGASVPLTLARPGQIARLTVAATAGQRLNTAVTNATLTTSLAMLKPDGSTWFTTSVSNGTVLDSAPLD